MPYHPGLHILLTINIASNSKLKDAGEWIRFIDTLIARHQLQSLGHIEHTFEGSGGYTAVHCLTESHISIHTWPEFGLCTCDVFLSNFKRDNSPIVRAISEAIVAYFESGSFTVNEITR